MTLDEYTQTVVVPAVLRMFSLPDTPAMRVALERYVAAEMADMKAKSEKTP
jgi:hypothetical protein